MAIKKILPDFVTLFQLKANSNTLKCSMTCSHDIDFTMKKNISKILDFKDKVYTCGVTHESENLVNISKINCIKVGCNLISGYYSSLRSSIPCNVLFEIDADVFLKYDDTSLLSAEVSCT